MPQCPRDDLSLNGNTMNRPQQRKLVDMLNVIKDYLQKEPGFIDDVELKAMYVVVSAAEAATMFGETPSLAKVCATWCEAVLMDATERN